jgi:uncharacterized protein
MKRALKIIGYTLLSLIVLAVVAMGIFIYKVKNGFPVSYETTKPVINFPENQAAVLVFSKTTGYRHSEAIDAAKPMFKALAQKNNWFLYETEEGGVFNPEQLAKFKAVVFNNSTGEVINDEQKRALESYVENGGGLIGIHGAGDDSHHWDWYEKNLLGSKFSHHPIKNQLQMTKVSLKPLADSTLWQQLPATWSHIDEWYVFFNNPLKNGFTGLYTLDGETIDTDGNILFVKSKNFGMGKEHPVAWFKQMGKGRTFYTSMGHTGQTFQEPTIVLMIENAVKWEIKG